MKPAEEHDDGVQDAPSSDAIAKQYEVFKVLASQQSPVDAVDHFQTLGIAPEVIDACRRIHRERTETIRILDNPPGVVASGRGGDGWYYGPERGDLCWPKLLARLKNKDWEDSNLDALNDASNKIVAILDPPNARDPFSSKGLVLGHVQSGKTTNYTSVTAKAADRGYRLIIILAGIHNELRRQTQKRLSDDLVNLNDTFWHPLTPADGDFTKPHENAPAFFSEYSDQAVLAVVKKNGAVLRKLIAWLKTAELNLKEIPALIIDDEADQATVSTAVINPLIRELIEVLPKCDYVGYTATPFANLLIKPSTDPGDVLPDLYPKDFIFALPRPQGYFGPEDLFGRDSYEDEFDPEEPEEELDVIRVVPDDEISLYRPIRQAEVATFVPIVAGALRDAVDWFVISTAARRVRGTGNRHATMLIHTSMRVAVHQSYKAPLEAYLSSLRAKLDEDNVGTVHRLKAMWDRERAALTPESQGEGPVQFAELRERLDDVLLSVKVVLDNSNSDSRLDYSDTAPPVTAIAVGGNTLSRGLTLEGLSTSFFVRSVSAYDTMLQMGRWFGFRQGYSDLARIWITLETAQWFRHLAGVEYEIRRQIDRYLSSGETPLTIGIKIRTHPALRVTAAARMKDSKTIGTALGGRRVQPRYFDLADTTTVDSNFIAGCALVDRLIEARGDPEREAKGQHEYALWRGIPVDEILKFIDPTAGYANHPVDESVDIDLVREYIEARNKKQTLLDWNVLVIGSRRKGRDKAALGEHGFETSKIFRSALKKSAIDRTDIKTLMSRRDAAFDLDIEDGASEDEIFDARMQQEPDTGLLVLYVIDRNSQPTQAREKSRRALGADTDILAAAFIFPASQEDEAVYVTVDLAGVEGDYLEDLDEEEIKALIEGDDEEDA